MVESIHIQNFRCFEDFRLDGFGRVNLIGGMNNSGKTILLEGIYLTFGHWPKILIGLKDIRYGEEGYWKKEAKSIFWDDLFFNRDKSKSIDLKGRVGKNKKVGTVYNIDSESMLEEERLIVRYFYDEKEYYKGNILFSNDSRKKLEILQKEYREDLKGDEFIINIMPTQSFVTNRKNLVNRFSDLDLQGLSDYVLQGFQVIDESILEVKIVSLEEPNLYLRRELEPLMPIELFGDAITKLARMVLGIIIQKNGAILIDEIENGIHYTNQTKVWELIFRLAKKFNVQVFATTHSREMIQAFNKVALEEGFEEEAKYIEMARHYKTKQIIGTVLSTDILKHKLEHNQAFRGE